jgi:hypothetical protein
VKGFLWKLDPGFREAVAAGRLLRVLFLDREGHISAEPHDVQNGIASAEVPGLPLWPRVFPVRPWLRSSSTPPPATRSS